MLDLVIVGGGISGLAAAYQAHLRGWNFQLLEASGRVGGVVETRYPDGLVLEQGADSILAAKPAGVQLARELGLEKEIVETRPETRGTYIVRHDKLRKLPEGFRLLAPTNLWAFLRSDVVSWAAKLRMAMDLFIPRRHNTGDESLANFVLRRFGRECLDRLAQPLIGGIYTADPDTLGMQAILPQFLQFEERYGSVLLGLRRSPEAGRAVQFVSFRRGNQQLLDALHERVKDSVRLGISVRGLQSTGEGWRVQLDGSSLETRRVVVATSAEVGSEWFSGRLGDELAAIHYLSSAAVNLVYPRLPLKGYGFVVPAVEGYNILACTYSHQKYAGRCPEHQSLLRTYLGGAHQPRILDWSDEQMIDMSQRELSRLLGLQTKPQAAWVRRFHQAMPVYGLGHVQRIARIRKEAALPGLALTGNYFEGVGVPDCIRLAREAVQKLP